MLVKLYLSTPLALGLKKSEVTVDHYDQYLVPILHHHVEDTYIFWRCRYLKKGQVERSPRVKYSKDFQKISELLLNKIMTNPCTRLANIDIKKAHMEILATNPIGKPEILLTNGLFFRTSTRPDREDAVIVINSLNNVIEDHDPGDGTGVFTEPVDERNAQAILDPGLTEAGCARRICRLKSDVVIDGEEAEKKEKKNNKKIEEQDNNTKNEEKNTVKNEEKNEEKKSQNCNLTNFFPCHRNETGTVF